MVKRRLFRKSAERIVRAALQRFNGLADNFSAVQPPTTKTLDEHSSNRHRPIPLRVVDWKPPVSTPAATRRILPCGNCGGVQTSANTKPTLPFPSVISI